ncbi:hypothetical protein ILT44_22130 [Microvirga sp. BT689]|uniref:hypothetical protein n=1 Tax=Microvirga arvi TaxID=2778731 RepID=UPI001951077F|nr:hypothetical protein [Microvirga arvi]MBM6582908.1 hypothetical protein [Microvirga arvi]
MTVRTAVFTCVVLAASSAAYAQDAATNNHCWGDITSDFAHIEVGIIGQHSRAHDPTFRGENQPRDGVGNVSKERDGPLSEGGQGDHAIRVGEQLEDATGVPIECE